jgi:hypothetical protein
MQRRPDLLPETQPPPKLNQEETTQVPEERRALYRIRTVLWIVILLLLLAFGLLAALVQMRPDLIGLARIVDQDATAVAVGGTINALEQTAQANEAAIQANQAEALALQSTRAVLVNQANLISQTETQQAVNQASTATAAALQSAQQATQAALNLAATQQALQLAATQVQLDFFATQTALFESFPGPTPTPLPNLTYLDEDFVNSPETINWQALPVLAGWGVTSDGRLIAQVDNATLLTTRTQFGPAYALNVEWVPISGVEAHYDILLGIRPTTDNQQMSGLVLRLTHDGQSLIGADLYALPGAPLTVDGRTNLEGATLILSAGDRNIAATQIALRLEIRGETLNILINGESIMTVGMAEPITGALGVQFPISTRVWRFFIES